MTNPETIYSYLRQWAPRRYCDDCVAKATEIYPRQQVNPICSALGLTTDFDREEAVAKIVKA